MKRILWILIACCLIGALAAGCGAKTEKPEQAGEEPATEAGEQAAPVEATDIVRLESIDFDEATKGLTLNLTKGTYTPSSTEEEYEYTITYGETVTMPLRPDATIDFPMVDDLTKAVTITADELTSEFLAYVQEFEDKPLFIAEMDGDAVKKLTYFYLP